jgi:hypothetical protein
MNLASLNRVVHDETGARLIQVQERQAAHCAPLRPCFNGRIPMMTTIRICAEGF